MKMKSNYFFILFLAIFVSCGEEVLTKTTQTTSFTSSNIETFTANTCSQMHFDKPPVDILYLIDNSASTLAGSFQQIKGQIQSTISYISNEFDYHVYFAPLFPSSGDNIQLYPVVMSDPPASQANINLVNPSNLEIFASASGNNVENGFKRSLEIINSNRSNGIFRNNANTIVVMISNGDDTQGVVTTDQGNYIPDPNDSYNTHLESFKKISKLHSNSTLNAESVRFISLVGHSTCNGWKNAVNYKKMSRDLYNYQGLSDNNSSTKDSKDLCSGNYADLFSVVNNSIRGVVVGHKYDHWRIHNQPNTIQENEITVKKIKANGQIEVIPQNSTDGFEYIGNQTTPINTRYAPTAGEPATGLMIKLNGNARAQFPECIIIKTNSKTEYYGYIALPKEPDLSTVTLEIDGASIPQSSTNGWGYIGYKQTQNIKVSGPTNADTSPAINKSGFFLRLFGNAIFSNGQTIKVFYKAKAL